MKSDTKKFSENASARTPTYEEISRRAYELWEKDGRPEGSEQDHWFRAEQQLGNKQPSKLSAGRL
ncbi:MAG TPA: DUF2934 domain-containing protein [Opitutaceae bacterium]|jgi:hypothetical protein